MPKPRLHMVHVPSAAADVENNLDLTRVRAFLSNRMDGITSSLTASSISGGRSNPTYILKCAERQWVLRRPPYGHVLHSAHDMTREFTVLDALAGTSVPVPRVELLCQDPAVIGAPFYIMEFVDGTCIDGASTAATIEPHQRRQAAFAMAQTLADLHEIDAAAIGLSGFGRPEGYLQRQLARWSKQWNASRAVDRPEVVTLLEKLHRTVPENRHPGIVHGDVKLDNIMLSSNDFSQVAALLDWEMATLGDTLCDVGIMLGFWDNGADIDNPLTIGMTRLSGFPTRAELLECYADRRGICIPNLDWYLVFADFKLAVILEGIRARHAAGATVGDGFDDVSDMVAPLLQRALETSARSRLSCL